MPQLSVTTIVLISDGLPGDFNHDHVVEAADYLVWRHSIGQTGDVATDANEDNVVDDADYAVWRANFGRTELNNRSGTRFANVPVSSTLTLFVLAACGFGFSILREQAHRRRAGWHLP